MTTTLRLVRDGIILELRRGLFRIVLDGNDAGSIESNQTVELPLDAGHHTLQVREGRYCSPIRTFDAADGTTVNFKCYGGRIWPIYLASFLKPDLALTLSQE